MNEEGCIQAPPPQPAVPAISVIVPVYNVAAHVAACLESLAAQSFADFEAIVIDDGSTDGSGEIARATVAGDPRFTILQQENAGLSAARNAGLDRIRGDRIAFLDSDDRLAPDYLARLHAVLTETGADWVACGVRFTRADGSFEEVPGIHGVPDLEGLSGWTRVDFDDWREVIRHYPSAWNKLYRRSLIEGLRFDEGLHYEDHAFFWRAAARTDHLIHLAEPLYLSTQGRPGQITRDGTERVFEQFAVLDILRGIVAQSPRPGGAEALAEITTRLSFERAQVIAEPARRARFVDQARGLLAGQEVAPATAARLGVPAAWCERLAGRLPVSVVIPSDGNPVPLAETLSSLTQQHLRDFEVIVVLDPGTETGVDNAPRPLRETNEGLRPVPVSAARQEIFATVAAMAGAFIVPANTPGIAAARNRGLALAQGRGIVFLDAGDRLPPPALSLWFSQLRRAGADFGFAGMVLGDGDDTPHSGLHDETMAEERRDPAGTEPVVEDLLRLHAHPSAKIFDRDFLLREDLRFIEGPLSSWHFLAACLARASRIVTLGPAKPRIALRPETRTVWLAPIPADDLAEAVAEVGRAGRLGPAAAARLLVRAIWEKVNFAQFPDEAARRAFLERAREILQAGFPVDEVEPDPYVGPWLRGELGLRAVTVPPEPSEDG